MQRRRPRSCRFLDRLALIGALLAAPSACDASFTGFTFSGPGEWGPFDFVTRLPEPAPVVGSGTLTMVAAADIHACGTRAGQPPLCWGAGFGDVPVAPGGIPALTFIASAPDYTCGIDENGNAHCWGAWTCWMPPGTQGSCDGEPHHLADSLRFRMLAPGLVHACGILEDRRVVCWGTDTDGQLGAVGSDRAPLDVRPIDSDARFVAIDAGARHTCAITEEGVVLCWGSSVSGQTGSEGTQCEVSLCTRTPVPVGGDLRFVSLALGNNHSCAIATDGQTWCWGLRWSIGAADQFGEGQRTPIAIPGDIALVKLSAGLVHTCGLDAAGLAWCWGGDNGFGERGATELGVTDHPLPVIGGRRYQSLSAGQGFTCALDLQGTAYCWGKPGAQLGRGPAQ